MNKPTFSMTDWLCSGSPLPYAGSSTSFNVLAAGVSLAIFALGGDALTRNNGQPVVLVNTSNFSLFSNG